MVVIVMLSVFFLASHGVSYDDEVNHSCIEGERQALLTFKQGLHDSKNLLSSWTNNSKDCCKWKGIRCNNLTNHIIMLDLRPNITCWRIRVQSLTPREFSTQLRTSHKTLNLETSRQSQLIDFKQLQDPSSINPSSDTTCWRIRVQSLTPREFSTQLRTSHKTLNLETSRQSQFHLTSNSFEWLSHLSYLRVFKLRSTNFTKSMDWFHTFKTAPSLSSLYLYDCQFPDLESFSRTTNSSNSITTIRVYASTFGSTTVSRLLNLSSNLLDLTLLSNFNVKGPILGSFENLKYLRTCYLSLNHFEGKVPKSMGSLCNVRELVMFGNTFNSTLDDIINILNHCKHNSSLEILNLGSNKLQGTFPKNVEHFPMSLKEMTTEKDQDSRGNEVMAETHVPVNCATSIAKLSTLKLLDVSNNSFTGVIYETHLENLSKLDHIDLSSNANLTLKLSNKWVPCFQLQYIGVIPSSISSLYQIETLILGKNNLSGTLPSSMKNCTRLVFLDVGENNLRGNISHNNINGMIPFCFNNFTSLMSSHDEKFDDVGSLQIEDDQKEFEKELELDNHFYDDKLIPVYYTEGMLIDKLNYNHFHGVMPSNLCHLDSIRILDISHNNINGMIPFCFNNFTSLMSSHDEKFDDVGSLQIEDDQKEFEKELELDNHFYDDKLIPVYYTEGMLIDKVYDNKAWIRWKGKTYEYEKILGLLRVIDLSSNKLIGEIPMELTNLVGLVQLNLSWNSLSGAIPLNIRNLSKLEALDFSHNNFSGQIPIGLAKMSSLAYLDLSYNHLSGTIPTSTQLQSFNASSYVGNDDYGLCGLPLLTKCPGDDHPIFKDDDDDDSDFDDQKWFDMSWFYIGLEVGFALGFIGVCGALYRNSFLLDACLFSGCFNQFGDWLYVMGCEKKIMKTICGSPLTNSCSNGANNGSINVVEDGDKWLDT
ncbi:hypothetical protein F8388_020941 [Cannabis sativa]|uniref:Leucine-rich repeat-containing N-terminal plant-type domain-containing protein n=1 Tax=Cannabis sativa TaxID=3483 RepID=A0A7J6FKH4_CANSA|nr:hypothetical protein F8388_020941 [Cannabis sativa]